MRALIKPASGPGLELTDVPEPSPGTGEVKIKVQWAGLCGTDLHILSWDDFAAEHVSPGQIIGHEFFGEIVELGDGVEQDDRADVLRVGDLVSVEGHVVCGRCRNCRGGRHHMCIRTSSIGVDRDGAFAEYVTVPAHNVWVQPPEIDPELGAIFDPFGNAVHTAFQYPLTGEDVIITGAGPIGIMSALIARHSGARHVVLTDIAEPRLELARRAFEDYGAVELVNPAEESLASVQERLGMREGFDVAFEMSGSPRAMASIIDSLTHGGKIAMLGLPASPYEIDWNRVITRMFTIKGVYGRQMFDTWYTATTILLSSEPLREALRTLITHRFPAAEWERAFEAAASGSAGKVLIDWRNA
ncbi:L-threonine 3-dehydrogenase [Flaviflexus salsibiostraticola]|uniref:L-threonine 3-dehydrogenase n=1 Tax=Flaviflexus salsibiostraticola TaxID=1282737 RepID=A0A3Q8WT71_9ACTO|nr:L-threonine 3-dehydrogenase [Flaviflexus salsibiostraticola]AZN29727.1 L-threonine 3-dehydrogenase [Flaviflexus salsibiostraticola]